MDANKNGVMLVVVIRKIMMLLAASTGMSRRKAPSNSVWSMANRMNTKYFVPSVHGGVAGMYQVLKLCFSGPKPRGQHYRRNK